jgi:hypothetical protein
MRRRRQGRRKGYGVEADEGRRTREPNDEDVAIVTERMRAGADRESIARMLQERGVDRMQARNLVDAVYPELARVAEAERYSPSALVPAIAGGVLAALVGGFVWGLIVIVTDYEVGFVAWGIGFLAGIAVVRFAGGRKGGPLQAVAVVASLLGIVTGKYISFAYFFKKAVDDRFGVELSYFDSTIFTTFRENLGDVFGGFDLLWAGLAIVTAWRLARPLGFRPAGTLGS